MSIQYLDKNTIPESKRYNLNIEEHLSQNVTREYKKASIHGGFSNAI